MILYTSNKKSITLGCEIARGGEGVIYEYSDSQVVKKYTDYDPIRKEEKLKCFINKNISIPNICTPLELLYDKSGMFVGFLMERASGKIMQNVIFQPQLLKRDYPNWTRIELTQLAICILNKIQQLHNQNILVGDINPYNINVVNSNKVYFVDVDSFQIDKFPCPVGTPEFTAPELLIENINFTIFLRSKEHEYFAIATLLFKIYVPGKNPYSRAGGGSIIENIKRHDFAFPLGDEDENIVPKGQWEAIWYNLPYSLRSNFYRVFKGGERIPLLEWIETLTTYLSDLNSNAYDRSIFPIHSTLISSDKTLNMNRRDITDRDTELRVVETILDEKSDKIAVLELSTKAVRFLMAKDQELARTSTFDFNNFHRIAAKTNTGRGLNKKNMMDMSYFKSRVLPTITKYKEEAQLRGVGKIYTVATAAYRTANNRDEILKCIKSEAGLNVRILKKEEEANATISAFQVTTRNKSELHVNEYVMVIDQGGGSTEVSLFHNLESIKPFSINLGTEVLKTLLFKESTADKTLRQIFSDTDSLIRERLKTFYLNIVDDFPEYKSIYCIAVGTAITSATGKKNNASQHDTVLTLESIKDKISQIDMQLQEIYTTAADLHEAFNQSQQKQNNLDKLVAMRVGLPMFVEVMTKFNINSLTVSGTGLWYGIYFQQLLNIK